MSHLKPACFKKCLRNSTKFSFHHKWNKAWLLLISIAYTSSRMNFITSYNVGLVSSLPPKFQIFQHYQKTLERHKSNFCRSALFHMKTRVCIKYLVHDCRTFYSLLYHGPKFWGKEIYSFCTIYYYLGTSGI